MVISTVLKYSKIFKKALIAKILFNLVPYSCLLKNENSFSPKQNKRKPYLALVLFPIKKEVAKVRIYNVRNKNPISILDQNTL